MKRLILAAASIATLQGCIPAIVGMGVYSATMIGIKKNEEAAAANLKLESERKIQETFKNNCNTFGMDVVECKAWGVASIYNENVKKWKDAGFNVSNMDDYKWIMSSKEPMDVKAWKASGATSAEMLESNSDGFKLPIDKKRYEVKYNKSLRDNGCKSMTSFFIMGSRNPYDLEGMCAKMDVVVEKYMDRYTAVYHDMVGGRFIVHSPTAVPRSISDVFKFKRVFMVQLVSGEVVPMPEIYPLNWKVIAK